MVDSSKQLLDNVDNVRLHHDLHTSGRPLRHRRGHYAQLDPMQMKDVCAMYKGGQANKKNLIIFGYVETELSLRQFLEDRGHEFVPFWLAYITLERVAVEPKLKLAVTAGIGSDHVNLAASCDRNIRWTRSRATSSAWPITST
ncbi:hypothetical protein PF008_g11672 [Phytophthora fragariae]|uniref:D-isomer specific 2-hydroxyacid dehydrogenase catalytic domain-containing protein n=1 Tax=Phytophthora fragariae TaxID=53985 RepID=A0A6G0RQ84_9STRA|nr:hypothetical protein PF008_g11672 [Phytophthora fragariae]